MARRLPSWLKRETKGEQENGGVKRWGNKRIGDEKNMSSFWAVDRIRPFLDSK